MKGMAVIMNNKTAFQLICQHCKRKNQAFHIVGTIGEHKLEIKCTSCQSTIGTIADYFIEETKLNEKTTYIN